MNALALLALAALPAWASHSVWTAADFDGDRRPDIVRLAVTQPFASLLPVDLDHDADFDLILRDSNSEHPVALWLNDGRGRFSRDAAPRRIPRESRSAWQTSAVPPGPEFTALPAAELVPAPQTPAPRSTAYSLLARRLPLSRSRKTPAARGPPLSLS